MLSNDSTNIRAGVAVLLHKRNIEENNMLMDDLS